MLEQDENLKKAIDAAAVLLGYLAYPVRTNGTLSPNLPLLGDSTSTGSRAEPAPVPDLKQGEGGAELSPSQRPVVWYRGKRVYQVNGWEEVVVTGQEDTVLQAFLKNRAMNDQTLADTSGYPHAAKILRALPGKYPCFVRAIRLPGGKSKGGYYMDLKDALKKNTPETK
jgi:hypothetical protein